MIIFMIILSLVLSAMNILLKSMKKSTPALISLLLLAVPLAMRSQFIYSTVGGVITITGYTGPPWAVTIPTNINGLTVTGIVNDAFRFTSITSMTIPASVTGIGEYSFEGCTSLTAITVDTNNPDYSSVNGVLFDKAQATLIQYPCGLGGSYSVPGSVINFGPVPFEYCVNLTSVAIPASVTNIQDGPFVDCVSLTGITVDTNNPDYSSVNGVLCDKNQDTLINYPGGLSIGYTIPGTVTNIEDLAFCDCTNLTSVAIPGAVSTIGASAFQGCSGLTNATFANGLTTIVASAFEGCASLSSLTIPASVTSIGDETFAGCTNLTSVYFAGSAPTVVPNSFEGVPATACYLPCTSGWSSSFAELPTEPWWQLLLSYTTNAGAITITGCSGLCGTMAVALPATINGLPVTGIGANAFENFTNLISIAVPTSVTNIGADAFGGCSSLTGLYFNTNAPAADATAFNDDTNATIYYLPGLSGWSSPFAGLPTVLATAPAQFQYTTNAGILTLTNYTGPGGPVVIPEAVNGLLVASIGQNAFFDSPLTGVTIPSGVTSIGQDGFSGSSLASVTIPNSVTGIGQEAFAGCANLRSVIIPGSITSFGSYAFSESGLTNVTILNGATSIGAESFYYCSDLASVTIPASVTSIGEAAFESCTSLSQITIPVGVTSIGEDAFIESGLTSITIPASVTSLGEYAFYGCLGLTNALLPASVTSLPYGLFSDCTSLTSVYFQGNAPTLPAPQFGFDPPFNNDHSATAYYLPGTTGWSAFSASTGLPVVSWNPQIQTSGTNFGVKNDQFGFNITGTPNIPIEVQASTGLPTSVWTSLTNVLLTNGSYYFSEPLQACPARYYRISPP